ncbi:alpha-2-macroglobulin domain-containing protein [Segniliparus rotundus DSM 44985]|uniref:Alpha-2-macroglobulin domain-containing protein n=1 Tax=Segniliparus rotundus (strain ATCC BAA-972 / CDC 1076 / CIP 108378 / DSM 44985 / JCM 13578) TaxID=640132 RepID=D6ZDW9_SEGRD|nr:alpha-2-macroglobulin domain-containing protein [Segniliparus rotundus DSM 44985]
MFGLAATLVGLGEGAHAATPKDAAPPTRNVRLSTAT